jgi:hypothetical protein
LVEISIMRQAGRTLLHLINLSGQSQTGYFPPVPMKDIHVEVAGDFRVATAVRQPGNLTVNTVSGYTGFTVPQLSDYELVVLK